MVQLSGILQYFVGHRSELATKPIDPIIINLITKNDIKNFIGEEIIKYMDEHPEITWEWMGISGNPNITMDIIEKYVDKPWDWNGISRNQNLTMVYAYTHLEKPWDWERISMNPNITMDIIEKYVDKPWN
jgi:hypothetical protein